MNGKDAQGQSGKQEWLMWKQRYEGLQRMIGVLEARLGRTDGIEGQETIGTLLSGLKKFASDQFAFLHNGFDPDAGKGYRLEPSLQYPADFVLGGTLHQVGFDLTVLQGVLDQRSLAKDDPYMKRTLAIADQLARAAMQPAIRHRLVPYDEDEVEVLTYFQKAAHIRLIPYACVALVGIPFTTLAAYKPDDKEGVGNARDLLAIPHEIGHYVFQHGLTAESRLQVALYEVLQGKPAWLIDWAEEIFADVYGCFVAGPVIVRDFLDLMRDNDAASLLENDEEHPSPVLRPFLYCNALTILAEKAGDDGQREDLAEVVESAERRWRGFLRSRGADLIKERRPIIKKAVEETFDLLIESRNESVEIKLDRLWSAPGKHGYDDLYEGFYEEVASGSLFDRLGLEAPAPAAEVEAAASKDGEEDAPEKATVGETAPLNKLATFRSLDRIRSLHIGKEGASSPYSGEEVDLIPEPIWTPVASMHGWTTEGPGGQPNPKFG